MESLETCDNLDDDLPYMLLLHERFILLTLANALEDIAVVGILHYDAERAKERNQINVFVNLSRHHLPERARVRIKEGLPVGSHEGVLDRCQDAHLVQGVFLLSVRQVLDLDLFESIDSAILHSLDLVDA